MNPYVEGLFVPRSVLVLDNAATHYNLTFQRILHDAGIRVVFLPPYSPTFNPIEQAFAKVKSFLRRHHRSFISAGLDDAAAVFAAFHAISSSDCAGYVRNSGYS